MAGHRDEKSGLEKGPQHIHQLNKPLRTTGSRSILIAPAHRPATGHTGAAKSTKAKSACSDEKAFPDKRTTLDLDSFKKPCRPPVYEK
jgi:hypothetical protein